MGKKRIGSCKKIQNSNKGIFNLPSNKKAQITIFMIVGLVILFTFVFLFQLVNSVQKDRLTSEQEKVFTKVFKKEAMRIYVEDCLSDELEEALIILGQQGRVWSDQPGGVKEFSENINGVENPPGSGNRLSYGLAKTQDLPYENAYPCYNQTNSSPEFCQYKFPENSEGFGELDLKTSTIRNDLRRYLINKTADCIINYTKTNISNKAEVEIEELNLGLNIENDGININADFPLKFSLGTEEFFHLSQFDFFYPTQFKWLLESAVVRPLFYDWKYLDFNYTENTLQQQTFDYASNSPECINGTCKGSLFYDKYSSLGITMYKEENENGDDIFIFSSPEVLNRPELYEFKVARQNRPPALDYINRSQCLLAGYDYLVIPDDEELGDINITLFALDPDEDNVTNSFEFECDNSILTLQSEGENNFYISGSDLSAYGPTKCTLTSTATDEHGEADLQETRILIDRPITLNITLELPYENITSFLGGNYYVSKEDPVYININWPQNSSTVSITDTRVNLTYLSPEGIDDFSYSVPSLATVQGESCINFPWTNIRECNIDSYWPDFTGWENNFNLDFSHFKQKTEDGILNLTFAADYCGDLTKEESFSANIVVKDCTALRNEQHPFSYPYEKYEFDSYDFVNNNGSYTGNLNAGINPFLATHSCCSGDPLLPGTWELREKGEVCFINPEPGCYGEIKGYTDTNKGYIFEQQLNYCDGLRGNVCNLGENYTLWQDQLTCGNNSPKYVGCKNIDPKCQELPAFSLIKDEGWCFKEMGCGDLCEKPVVYTGNSGKRIFSTTEINKLAKDFKITSQTSSINQLFPFTCGCSPSTQNMPCDHNYDGDFNYVCSHNDCKPVTCNSGEQFCVGHLLATCSNTGTDISTTESCPSGQVCLAEYNACKPKICAPEQLSCLSSIVSGEIETDFVVLCNEFGNSFSKENDCTGGHCENAQCKD